MGETLRTRLERLTEEGLSSDGVRFRPIRTEEDLIWALFDCRLPPEQQKLVNPAGFSVGRAYLDPANNVPCLILGPEGRPVGFLCFGPWRAGGEAAWTWSFFVDEREQGRGLGRSAAKLAARLLKTAFPERHVKLATEADNDRAQRLYRSLGFRLLEERDGDDLVFAL